MKKAIKALFALLFAILIASGGLAAEIKNNPGTKAIDNYIAVFDFEVRYKNKKISRSLTDKVIHVLSESGQYEVIDRGKMKKIFKKKKFRIFGCVTKKCKIKAGRILGVSKIVNGSIGKVGKTYHLKLQLIDVKSGKIEISVKDKCKGSPGKLLESTSILAEKLLAEKIEQPAATAMKPEQPAATVTKPEQPAVTVTKPEQPAATTTKPELIAKPITEAITKIKTKSIAKSSRPEKKVTNSIGMTFVYIKPGKFMMGSPSDESGRDGNETQHEVTLTKGFYMQTTEVTERQWQAVMGNNPSCFSSCGGDCPVENVSWNDVHEFIRKLNKQEGTDIYRLPTEAEWEYAARAGSESAFAGGGITKSVCGYDPVLDALGWYCGNSDIKKHPVAKKNPNSWGLYDIHGNIWEWCQDWMGDYPPDNVTDPAGPSTGSHRLSRGGSGFGYASHCRLANRIGFTPDTRRYDLGFRLTRTP